MKGMIVAVAGGAGHIGSAICSGLTDMGATVYSLSSKPCRDERVTSIIVDCGDEDAMAKAVGQKRFDGFVCCAGRAPRHASLDMEQGEFDRGVKESLGVYFACMKFAASLIERGAIVNVASMWGGVAPDLDTYQGMGKIDPSFCGSAAGGAVMALTRHMAVHLAPRIRVNALVPGWFPAKRGPERPDYIAAITSRVPLGRIGDVSELVGPAAFLLSSASSYMTGQALVIDGGYTAK